jgi:hypothetical protein
MKHATITAASNQAEPCQYNKRPSVEELPVDRAEFALPDPPKPWPTWFHPSSDSYGDYGDEKVGFFD